MSTIFRNKDFILQIFDDSQKCRDIANKYSAFLECLCPEQYAFQREAIKIVIEFFVSERYRNTEELVRENYEFNKKIHARFENASDYLIRFPLKDKKSVSADLATGTGKSWVIYGIAQIMLAEGLVDKVLVLCPSLTIEDGLKDKFNRLSGDANLQKILQELDAAYPNPAIKSANVPILAGDICVENIHAVYERTGSSVPDSFRGKGRRTLVINDEAHHIFSKVDQAVKRWLGFLQDNRFDFHYIANVSGTPYIGNDYFLDVIYRYSLKRAIEDRVVKKIDYKIEEESHRKKGFYETWHNHQLNKEKYAGILKPLTIIVTEKIISCVKVWKDFVEFLAEKEKLTPEEAARKVIWVVSGIPAGRDGKIIKSIISHPEQARKANLQSLKTVDDEENPVEWIISVSMLTEGWDVKNIFQIVPHENRAFNSKLLIAQVLGRGLRIPEGIGDPVLVKINNHTRWTPQIANLYRDVLEIENTFSWGFFDQQKKYFFPLYNLAYESVRQTVEVKKKPSKHPSTVSYAPQSKEWYETSRYSESGTVTTIIENNEIISIKSAVRQMKIFLKEKDEKLAREWTGKRLDKFIRDNLKTAGCDNEFISRKNLALTQMAFGPMFRRVDEENPRLTMKPKNYFQVDMREISRQSFNESALKEHGYIFFSGQSIDGFVGEEKMRLSKYLDLRDNYEQLREDRVLFGDSEEEIKFLKENFYPVESKNFKTPWNIHFVRYEPERKFSRSLFDYTELFDSIVKAPDKGFYSFPYSYKPSKIGKSHPIHENFNPDFFLRLAGKKEILVVEIKDDADDSAKNRAKNRDGREHFIELNTQLKNAGIQWRYYFYFLSPEDYTEFFAAVREDRYPEWKSRLMQSLES